MYLTNLLALFFFLVGAALLVRASRAERWNRPKYLRAAAGAMAVGLGNAVVLKSPAVGLMFFLAGVWLIFTVGRA